MDRLLLRALPYPDPDLLVALHETQTGKGFRNVSLPNLMDWRAQSSAFDGMAGFMTRTYGMRGGRGDGDNPLKVINAGQVTSDLFYVLRGVPQLGRTFTEREELDQRRLLVLTDALWERQFHRAGDILGRTVQLNDEAYVVIGVLPPEFVFPDPTVSVDAYMPVVHADYNNREVRPLQAIARLKADAGFGRTRSELRAIGARLAQAYPEDNLRGGGDLEGLD